MHRHVFKMVDWQAEDHPVEATIAIARCECGHQIGPTEIERRLNAVEGLSAEDARMAADSFGEVWAEYPDLLRAYALALEGAQDVKAE